MSIIGNLFSKSPFMPLQTHMEKVALCVEQLDALYAEFSAQNFQKVKEITDEISELEHSADLTKNDIRANLPRGMFLALNRADLLKILSLQDSIADAAEDLGVILTLKKLKPVKGLNEQVAEFLHKNVSAVKMTHEILKDLDQLLQSTYSGTEASQIRQRIKDISYMEHESDVIQRQILQKLYNIEDNMHYSDFHLWLSIIKAIASLGDISERLANKISMIWETS